MNKVREQLAVAVAALLVLVLLFASFPRELSLRLAERPHRWLHADK